MGIKLGQGTRAVTVPATAAGASVTPITAPCRLKGWSLLATGAPASEADATVAAPGALTVIAATGTLPAGDYQVQWLVELAGTLAAGTDNDNFQLFANGAVIAHSVNPAVAGEYQQLTITVRLTASGTIAVRSTGAATAGSTYRAAIVATPAAPGTAAIMDSGQVLGQSAAQFGFSDTQFLDEEGLYVSTGITVSVIQGTISGVIYVKDFIAETEL